MALPVIKEFVVPGDVVLKEEDIFPGKKSITIKAGTGLCRVPNQLVATKAGRIRSETDESVWLDCRQRWVSRSHVLLSIDGHSSNDSSYATTFLRLRSKFRQFSLHPEKYLPTLGDPIIGRILSKHAEHFRVDIGQAHAAILSSLAFERTVKKNRPNFEAG